MSLIFEKYYGFGTNYLIYDINRNKIAITKEMILSIFKNNLGHGLMALLVGPYIKTNEITWDVYNRSGVKISSSILDSTIFHQYLIDRNYLNHSEIFKQKIGGYESMITNTNVSTLSMDDVSFQSYDITMSTLVGEMINIPFYFGGREYWGTCLSHIGSHLVIPMEEISGEKMKELGPIATNSKYFSNGISCELVKVVNRNMIRIELYEEEIGYTISSIPCAMGAAAAVYKLGLIDNEVTVHMLGGAVLVNIKSETAISVQSKVHSIGHIYLMNQSIESMSLK